MLWTRTSSSFSVPVAGVVLRGLALGFIVASRVGAAHAQTLPFGEISVRHEAGAESCPSESELVARTLSLGGARADAPTEPLKIEVSFARRGSDYIAHLSASGRKTGERELFESGPECGPLLDATAVVLSVLLDLLPPEPAEPAPVPEASDPAPAPTPPPLTAQQSVPTRPMPPALVTPPSEASLGAGARLAGGAGYGLLGDAVSPWLSAAAFVRFLGIEASLEGFFVPERRIQYAGGYVEVDLLGGMLEACYDERLGAVTWLRAGACGSFGLGMLSGRGRGFDHPGDSTDLWMGAGVSVDARAAFTRALGLRLELSSLFLPVSQTLSVENVGKPFRTTDASVILSVGPELTIW